MPRSSDGSYSLPTGTIVNTGDTILVSQHNPPLQDIAVALGNSVDRDGKGGMRANLNMNGNRVTNVADGVDDSDVATVGQIPSGIDPSDLVPIGAVIDYWGTTPPTGYLFPVGQAVSRTTYAALFAVIGTAAGAGDGSTTFNLPDYRGRVSAAKDDLGGANAARLSSISATTMGATGGSQTHTLTTAEMPSHNHALTDPGHSHSYTRVNLGGTVIDNGTGASFVNSDTSTATTGITLAAAGGGGAHNNVQPTIVCTKIMRVS